MNLKYDENKNENVIENVSLLSSLYDYNVNTSILLNDPKYKKIFKYVLNKEKTLNILNTANEKDIEKANSDSTYVTNHPSRLYGKIADYMEPFQNRHININSMNNLRIASRFKKLYPCWKFYSR